jgi:hypothetical protein
VKRFEHKGTVKEALLLSLPSEKEYLLIREFMSSNDLIIKISLQSDEAEPLS